MYRLKYLFVFSIIIINGCADNDKIKQHKSPTAISNDTISTVREKVHKKAVASYVTMGHPKLDRKFGVEIFETPETFKYLLVMYHDGTIENDTLAIPDFGIWPVIKIKPGNEKLSCIIGFMDKKNNFREYKMLMAKKNKLSLITLKRYAVATSIK